MRMMTIDSMKMTIKMTMKMTMIAEDDHEDDCCQKVHGDHLVHKGNAYDQDDDEEYYNGLQQDELKILISKVK